jgi:beta-lactamase regulating signal transducer with metallopeptidase domain
MNLALFALNTAAHAILAAGLGCLAVWLLRRRPAPLRYGLLLTALLFVLASPATAWLAGGWGVGYIRWGRSQGETDIPVCPESSGQTGMSAPPVSSVVAAPIVFDSKAAVVPDMRAVPTVRPPAPLPEPVKPIDWPARILAGVLGVWLLGAVIGLALLARGRLIVRKLNRSLKKPTDPRLSEETGQAARLLDVAPPPTVAVTDLLPTPLSLGLFKPKIIFPQVLEHSLSDSELQGVILHETAHIAHRDHWAGLLQRLAGAVFWWNPLLRRLNGALAETREEICDNYVLPAQGGGEKFACCLVEIAEKTTAYHRLPAAVGLIHPRRGFEERVRGLLRKERNTMTRMNLVAVAALFAVGLGVVLLACSVQGEDGIIVVTDESGKAIEGADVYAVSLSMNAGPAKTDTNGKATLPANIQGTKWVDVSKAGFESTQIDVPQKWPLKVILKAQQIAWCPACV